MATTATCGEVVTTAGGEEEDEGEDTCLAGGGAYLRRSAVVGGVAVGVAGESSTGESSSCEGVVVAG